MAALVTVVSFYSREMTTVKEARRTAQWLSMLMLSASSRAIPFLPMIPDGNPFRLRPKQSEVFLHAAVASPGLIGAHGIVRTMV